MNHPDRRTFLAATAVSALWGAPASIDKTLSAAIARRGIPAVVAMVASGNKMLYAGAFGQRDTAGAAVKVDSIFQIASMTKAITTVAALQFGEPQLRPAKTIPTLRQLLTHTSGLCYDTWDADMFRYTTRQSAAANLPGPLMFEPGKRWQYGQGIDWAGRLVEAVGGLTLEDYFQQKILQPLGMVDTSYILPPAKFDRLVTNHSRAANGQLQQDERKLPVPPASFNGGGGLYSTAADYIRFMQMILNRGAGILQPGTVASMRKNQIGALTAGKMKTSRPNRSADVDIQPEHTEKWGLGFLINTSPYAGGRAAGSLAWAGLFNTFYWIDPKRNLCAVLLMQFLPFVDKEAVGLLDEFERAVYQAKLA